MELGEVQALSGRVLDEVEKAVIGKREPLELVLLGFLADGHVLLEDYPGLAKTLAARSFAQVLSMDFARIQFTPDLMPSDVTGSSIWNQRDSDFEFRPGPVFTNLLLADEINRAPPKTQAALLEAMQERQATIEGVTHRFEPPFLVIATQNPIEYEGTYPLPEAQLDRFLLRTAFGYPSREGEVDVLTRRIERASDDVELRPVIDRATLIAMQQATERVHVAVSVREYCVDVTAATRTSQSAAVGASPRGSLALLKLARCRAALQGRDFVLPDDVKAIAVPALAHRLVLRPELWVQRITAEDVVGEVLDSVPTPPAEDARPAGLVTRAGNPRLVGYAALAALGLLGALALRRPELAIVAAPFALLLAVGTRARDPAVEVVFAMDAERTLEGAEVEATLILRAQRAVDRVEVLLELPRSVEVVDGQAARAIRLRAGEEREIDVLLRCTRWGSYRLGGVRVRARDVLRLVTWEARADAAHRLKAYPRPVALRRLLAPMETQALAGSQVARSKGDGVEYADIRDFVPGDRVRSINWRASARHQGLVVNERHPERNTDVVLFIDSFADVRGADRSVLEDAVRAAASLATRYLEHRDRVGLVGFGGVLRWLQPGMGTTQRYRLVETMLETGVEPTYTWRDVNVIPARILPPGSSRPRAHTARRSPHRDCARGSARAPLRRRGGRGRPRRSRRARSHRGRARRVPPVAPRA